MAEAARLAWRVLRQWGVAARMDFLLVTSSPGQALFWTVTELMAYAGGFASVLLVAERFGGLAGWSKGQLVFLYGFSTTTYSLRHVLFGYNVAAISRRIGRGQLDHTLVQPMPLALSLLTEGFAPLSSAPTLVLGASLLFAGAVAAHVHVTAAFVSKLVVCLLSSMTLVLAGSFAIGASAFWAPRGAEEISTRADNLLSLTDFPLDPLPRGLRTVLLTAIPAGFVAWFPASALLGRSRQSDWFYSPFVALVAALAATALFKKGLGRYARTGSSRYSDFGHRR